VTGTTKNLVVLPRCVSLPSIPTARSTRMFGTVDEPLALAAPSLVVLVGPVASGKSTWAGQWFDASQIASSDAMRAIVGEAEHDRAASPDAFAVLDDVVARRLRRRLTTVVDTLGLDPARRRRWRELAASAGVPCVAVVFDTPPGECRRRNAARQLPVPADVLDGQLRRWPDVRRDVHAEPWDDVLAPDPIALVPSALAPSRPGRRPVRRQQPAAQATAEPAPTANGAAMRIGVQLSAFDWPGGSARLAEHLGRLAGELEAAGVAHLWVMDHLRQIPQVGPAWADVPEAYSTLAWLAARTARVRLGTLVTPAFLRPAGIVAQAVATLDVLSNGRAMCGLGVGWFRQEYDALGIRFPPVGERYEHLEDALRVLPLLWGKGTPSFSGHRIDVPEAMCYPRPLQPRVPMWVGGSGERRTLRLVARYADACNLFGEPDVVSRKVAALRAHCDDVGRDPSTVEVTHLSTVLVGRDRGDVDHLVDALRPQRWSRERFARHVNAGTVGDHLTRAGRLADAGVSTMIVSLADAAVPGAAERLAALVDRLP
jgi:F420-dependent oxidoreductase-like protein